jgi:hypothetical protein
VSKLTGTEFRRAEAKGSLLTLEHRQLLLQILRTHPTVMLVPVTLNLGHTDPQFLNSAPSQIRALIESNRQMESSEMPLNERKDLARRIGNLSGPAITRLLAYAIAIFRSLEAITLYYHCARFYDTYERIRITFDKFGARDSREELVFRAAIFGYLANWSARFPIAIAPEVTLAHPLSMLYAETRSGRAALNLRKMLAGGIEFADSRLVWQIRLADFVVSTWSKALSDYDGKTGHRPLFRYLNEKTVLQGNFLLGISALTDDTSPVAAPPQFEIFRRMVLGDAKILPC